MFIILLNFSWCSSHYFVTSLCSLNKFDWIHCEYVSLNKMSTYDLERSTFIRNRVISYTNLSEHCSLDLVLISASIVPVMFCSISSFLNCSWTIVACVVQPVMSNTRITWLNLTRCSIWKKLVLLSRKIRKPVGFMQSCADDMRMTYVIRMSSAVKSRKTSHSDVIRTSSAHRPQRDLARLQT